LGDHRLDDPNHLRNLVLRMAGMAASRRLIPSATSSAWVTASITSTATAGAMAPTASIRFGGAFGTGARATITNEGPVAARSIIT
jgi:hypothetical protein